MLKVWASLHACMGGVNNAEGMGVCALGRVNNAEGMGMSASV